MKIHAIVFYDSDHHEPLCHKIYDQGSSKYERRFVTEFVEFGRKDFLKKMRAPCDEFVISLVGGSVLVYVTVMEGVGVAMMLSNIQIVNTTPHIVSKKLINDIVDIYADDSLLQ